MPQNTIEKKKIIVGLLLKILIILEVHGVIHLIVEIGIGVTYRCVEVSKIILIHIYGSGVNHR
jgi:hypothetical protein